MNELLQCLIISLFSECTLVNIFDVLSGEWQNKQTLIAWICNYFTWLYLPCRRVVLQVSVYRSYQPFFTHWDRVTHIYVSKLTIIGSDDDLSPARRQPIIWTNAGILLTGRLGTNFNDILIEINTFWLKKIFTKMSSGKWRLFYHGLNVLRHMHQLRMIWKLCMTFAINQLHADFVLVVVLC